MLPSERQPHDPPPPRQSGLRESLLWNLAALAPLAVLGLVINLVVGRYYGPGTLGTFNQVLAVYLVLSQLSVGGFCYSALAAVGAYSDDRPQCRWIVVTALGLAAGLSAVVAVGAFAAAPLFGAVFDSPDVTEGVRAVAPGLFFFSLNKVLLFSLNGLGHLRAFALCQAARYLLLLAAFGGLIAGAADGATLPLAFSLGEAGLFVLLALCAIRILGWPRDGNPRPWFRRHIDFGHRAYWNGLLYEVGTKADILVLGILLPDDLVGIYAFAANIAEGIAQIPVALQTVLTPRLSAIARTRDQEGLSELRRRTARLAIPGMAALGLMVTAVFPSFADLVTGDPAFGESWPVLALLLAGIAVTAGHMPFVLLLNQAGHPEAYNTLLQAGLAATVLGTFALVPFLGLTGAALGVALSLLVSVLVLRRLARRVLGLSL